MFCAKRLTRMAHSMHKITYVYGQDTPVARRLVTEGSLLHLHGAVIKGWDEGVKTFKKGEKALLTCKADYAYGDQGSPPKIPPNATLNFEVRLIDLHQVVMAQRAPGLLSSAVTCTSSKWQCLAA